MAKLDAFIEKLFAQPTAQLVFETGQGATLESASGRVRLIQQPLTSQQIIGAFTEVAPAELQRGFPRPGTTSFPYRSRSGEVEIRFEARQEGVRVVVTARAQAAAAGASATATATSTASSTGNATAT